MMTETNTAPNFLLQSWPKARQWNRAPLRAPVTIKLGSITYHGWCKDVCPGGLGFTCAAPVEIGDEISVMVSLEGMGEIHVRGLVRHSAAFRSGCEFLFISPNEQETIDRYTRTVRPTRRCA
jgi:hypothetical protein